MNCMTRLFAIIQKEVRQLLRDRLTFAMIVGIPMMQIILFGYAINTDVRHLRGAVADEAGTQLSRELVDAVQASQVLDMTRRARDAAELEQLLRVGEIDVGVYIPRDFERRLQQADRPAAQLLVDGSDPVLVGTARGLTGMTLRNVTATPVEPQGALFEVRNYYNPERRSAVFVVPGLIGVILTMTMVLFTAVAIVRERERGNLEMLITTPVKSAELMLGKILPYVLIGIIQVTLIMGLGLIIFHVPVNGTVLDVYLASLLFIAANLSLGLVISTAVQNQFQAMQMTFFFFMPSILLSGFMFPFDGMPRPAQLFAELLPLTHFVRLIRGIMLRGAGLFELIPEMRALLIFMVVTLTLATLRFRKRLD
ncbi:MAG: transporter [Proteobacteria bacterium]|nr:transporter [Pseudomonadota bacterium]